MAKSRKTSGCPNCDVLWAELKQLRAEVKQLRSELQRTQNELDRTRQELSQARRDLAKARKDSGNSSKPPSGDIVKPKKKSSGKTHQKRRRGAQPGHERHQREPFDESEIDLFRDYAYTACPDCGGPVEPCPQTPRTLQQVELVVRPVQISEHRGRACWCAHCQRSHSAPIDENVRRAGLVGPRLTALVAFLKGACHCSFSTIQNFLRHVVGVRISRGQLSKLCRKVSESLASSYQDLLGWLPQQESLHVDETGHKDNGRPMWTWCFRAATFTLFKIDPSRGSQVLLEVLGEEFDGVLGCDYFSAYRKYMRLNENVLVQFCLAHFLRDVKFLVGHPEPRNRAYGRRILKAARALFALIHRREEMDPERFAGELEDAGNELEGQVKFGVPRTPEAENLADRFWQHGASYLRFLTTPEIEPTNNLAEQAIRFVVIDRHVTQGSRSEAGQRWLERIWTALATCTQQGRSLFEFLNDSVLAHFRGLPPPSLLPDPS